MGDDDLLEVVGQSSQESVIQSHLKKLFAGIHSINLNKQSHRIVEICSLEGEIVELDKSVDIGQPVEVLNWICLIWIILVIYSSIIDLVELFSRSDAIFVEKSVKEGFIR